jgi:hypothetical protein
MNVFRETKKVTSMMTFSRDSLSGDQAAFWIFPAFRQEAQTLTRLTEPFTTARTCCRFGSHRRGDRLFAWLTLLPAIGFLPQISHAFAIILYNSFRSLNCLNKYRNISGVLQYFFENSFI